MSNSICILTGSHQDLHRRVTYHGTINSVVSIFLSVIKKLTFHMAGSTAQTVWLCVEQFLCVLAAFLEQKIDHLTLWFDWIVQRDWWGNVHIIEHIFQKQATLNDLSYNRKAKKNQSCVKHWPFASATNKVVFYRLF